MMSRILLRFPSAVFLRIFVLSVFLFICGCTDNHSDSAPSSVPSALVPPSANPSLRPKPEGPEPTAIPTSTPSATVSAEPVVSESASPVPSPSSAPILNNIQKIRVFYGLAEQQFADLYREQSSRRLPVVVMIHGGCWSSIYSLALQDGLSQALAEQGFAVWNIEYRSLGNGGEWPVMFQDVALATDYLREIAEQYSLDLSKLSTLGHSAGGHLALWLISRDTIPELSELYVEQPLLPNTALSLGGIPSLESSACGTASQQILNKNGISAAEYQARLNVASPMLMLPTERQTILITGSTDGIAPPALSEAYTEAAIRAGDSSVHHLINGAGHFYLIDQNRMDLDLIADSLLGF